MPSTSLEHGPAIPRCPTAGGPLPGLPWSVRLAGADSPRPALELYEDGILLDVVSSTPVAPQLVRGVRAASHAAVACSCSPGAVCPRPEPTSRWSSAAGAAGAARYPPR